MDCGSLSAAEMQEDITDLKNLLKKSKSSRIKLRLEKLLAKYSKHADLNDSTGTCCPSTRLPALIPPSTYKGQGSSVDLNGLKVYITGSQKNTKAIVVLADVLGMESGRHKGIADQFADAGYYVVMPDLFHGDTLTFADIVAEDKSRTMEFIKTWPSNKWAPDMDKVYAHLEENKIGFTGLIGFCWGSWAIFHESARGRKFNAGACFHPSLRIESMMNGSVDDLANKCQTPMLMGACSNDPDNVKPGGSVNTILSQKSFAGNCQYHLFEEQEHGFVSQGDLSNKSIARDVELAMNMAMTFFSKHLSAEGGNADEPREEKNKATTNEILENLPQKIRNIKRQKKQKVHWKSIEEYSWDQNDLYVKVYIGKKYLAGVGSIDKENIKCSFEDEGFSLSVTNLNDNNYKLTMKNLSKDYVSNQSKLWIGKNKIIVKLRKVKEKYGADQWYDLTSKTKFKPNKKTDDPTAGLMDMMKKMYDDGDDKMKETIGKAMYESRMKQNQPGGFDKPPL